MYIFFNHIYTKLNLVLYLWFDGRILSRRLIFLLNKHTLQKEIKPYCDVFCFCNSLAPGIFQLNLRKIIFKLSLVTDGYDISSEIALRLTSQDLSGDKSTLVQVMAWCRQATSHYLNQCWPTSLPPYGVIRPQWVKSSRSSDAIYICKPSPHWFR